MLIYVFLTKFIFYHAEALTSVRVKEDLRFAWNIEKVKLNRETIFYF